MKAINRVIHYIDNKGINNSSFEKMCGLSNGYLGTQLKRNADLGEGVLNKILDNCLDVSPEWLLTGRGEMLKGEGAREVTKAPPIEIIAPVKVEGRDLMPKVIVVDDNDNDRIPLVPIKAQAGYLTGYDDPVFLKNLPTYSVPEMRNGTYRMFQVKGLSMFPTLQDSSYVVGKFVEDWESLPNNRVCVVVTDSDGIIVKRVINRIKKYGTLYCKSDNRDYPHISIGAEDIKEVWECKMHLSFEFLDPLLEYEKIADLEANVQHLSERIGQLEEEMLLTKST